MRSRRKRARLALMIAVALAAAGAGVTAYETHALRWLELDSVDARFSVRGDRPAPKDVAVVAVDTTTFNDFPNQQWPYPRAWHARAVRILKAAGARVIVYDVQFTEPSRYGKKDDIALLNASYDAGNLVFGTPEIGPHGSTRIFGGDKAVHAVRALPASTLYPLDPGAVIRRIDFQTLGLKTMPIVAYQRAFHRLPNRKLFEPDGAWIDYNGGPGSLETISFSHLLNHRFPKDAFRGRIVVVGASAQSLQDVHPTSTSGAGEMSGPEIQAHAIDTMIRGVPLRPGAHSLELVLILALALLAPLAGLRFGALVATAAALAGIALFLLGDQLAFNGGRILTTLYPLATSLVSTAGVVGVHYFTEVRERRWTRHAFARFVPAAVVDRVLEQAEDGLRLGGEEVLGTVLFSDIRGFTTFSESHGAAEVIDILNHYLTEMTEAIMGHGGTLIGYLGDGIIAIFGAPLEQADHADRALAAAKEMLGPRLKTFNDWVSERGMEQGFAMGIGINSGLFMAGNVGSQDRLEYTVIGDTVNTAARMEALTKGSGHSLFIAESTKFMLTREPPALDFVGEFAIRGREAKMKIWAPETPGAEAIQPRARSRASGIYEIKAEG